MSNAADRDEQLRELQRANEQLVLSALSAQEVTETLTVFLSSSPDLIAMFDAQLNVLFINAAAAAALGLNQQGVSGRTLVELGLAANVAEQLGNALETASKKRRVVTGEVEIQTERGARQFEWVFSPVLGFGKELTGITLTARDIGRRKQAEEALREHAEFLEHAPVVVRNLDDEIVLWNSGTEEMYGFSREEALGRAIHDLLQTVHPEPLAEIRAALLRDGRWEGELKQERRDGTTISVLSLQVLHRDRSGQAAAIIEINRDITRRKLAEEQLERLRSEFYGVISHELKTPLTAIKGSAAIALSGPATPGGEDARDLFEVISDQADRLTEMVANLLDMTRIEAGTFSVDTREAELPEIIADALNTFKRAGYPHHVRVKIPKRLPAVRADRRRIVQVLTNLLTNAAKFSPPDLSISLAVAEDGDSVVVRVRDAGVGIAPEKLPLLFNKFSQAQQAKEKGTGLGLWISESIIKAHGGRIWAESDGPGKGSTFSFTVPAFGAAERNEEGRVVGLRVLAVDDEPSILRFVDRFLTVAGHQVVTTTDPLQVCGLVEADEPDVLVLDMKMPGKSGVEILEEIRRFSQVPVVVITATENEQEIARARSYPGVSWLPKPFAPEELLEHVRSASRQRQRSKR